MRNYLKTQQNQFGQMTGSSLEENVTASTVQGDISGRYVKLVDVAHGITDQAAGQLWEAVSTEPDERCWTYLPYSAPQSQQSLKDSLKNLVVFQYEGLFRQDCILKGHNRNTAWFSMIDDEWSELKNAYQQWLSPDNFDEHGFQKQKLSDFLIE